MCVNSSVIGETASITTIGLSLSISALTIIISAVLFAILNRYEDLIPSYHEKICLLWKEETIAYLKLMTSHISFYEDEHTEANYTLKFPNNTAARRYIK